MEKKETSKENVKIVSCSLFDAPVNIIIHQCNCFCTWGKGLAKEMKKRYPRAYDTDLLSVRGDPKKLGDFTISFADDGKAIVNLYGQYKYGSNGVFTSTEALYRGFSKLDDFLELMNMEGQIIGIPFGLGAGLGGGDWNEIEKIIRAVFRQSKNPVLICKL